MAVAVVFLDASVLFSAAYRPDAGLLRLWDVAGVELISSDYAVQEGRRNLPTAAQRERLERLTSDLRLVGAIPKIELPRSIELPGKDRPILVAAISVGATHLLTGDVTHFGKLFGSSVGGVLILRPAEFLRAFC